MKPKIIYAKTPTQVELPSVPPHITPIYKSPTGNKPAIIVKVTAMDKPPLAAISQDGHTSFNMIIAIALVSAVVIVVIASRLPGLRQRVMQLLVPEYYGKNK